MDEIDTTPEINPLANAPLFVMISTCDEEKLCAESSQQAPTTMCQSLPVCALTHQGASEVVT